MADEPVIVPRGESSPLLRSQRINSRNEVEITQADLTRAINEAPQSVKQFINARGE